MSLAYLKCWTNPQGAACDPTNVVPGLKQSSRTLYVVWSGCVDWSGAGAVIPWEGYNVEWVSSNRTLLLHCYTAKPWLYFPDRVYGAAAINPGALLAIPTSAMGSGDISIEEDDRLEHLVGDQSTVVQLATATIE